jgi:hypothetical protein
MRTWISFPTRIKGIRLGAAVNLNTAARMQYVSLTGAKVWYIGSALMLAGLLIWLLVSRDQEGRLNENFLLVTIMVFAVRYLLKQAVVAIFPPIETPPK